MATKARSKKLTATEKRMISTAAGKALKFNKQKLTADKRDAIFLLVETMKGSKKPVIGKEAIALWAAKIDYAIANGDHPGVKKLLKTPTGPEMAANPAALAKKAKFYDSNGGCSCGGNGGTTGW